MLRPPPHPLPPLFIQHPSSHLSIRPSIRPSIYQPSPQTEKFAYPSSIILRNQSRQASQATNTPKSFIFLLVHDPSSTVCVFQQTKQAEPTNTPTKGRIRIVKKKGWVAHQQQINLAAKRFPQISILALHW